MRKPILRIFIAEHCPGCVEARDTARHIQQEYPDITVTIIDIGDTEETVPAQVFATPTYMLDDQVVSLGNPAPDDIAQWMSEAESLHTEG